VSNSSDGAGAAQVHDRIRQRLVGGRYSALSAVGLRAFFRLAARWQLDACEQAVLLACSRRTLARWVGCPRATERSRLHRDRIERISTLLAIDTSARALMGPRADATDEALANWLRRRGSDPIWNNRSPLDLMLGGSMSDLLAAHSLMDYAAPPPGPAGLEQPKQRSQAH